MKTKQGRPKGKRIMQKRKYSNEEGLDEERSNGIREGGHEHGSVWGVGILEKES